MVETNIMDAKNIHPYYNMFNNKRKGDRNKHSFISLKKGGRPPSKNSYKIKLKKKLFESSS